MAEIKCPCGLRNYMEEEDCKKTNCNACCPLTRTQTNADRIRAMSDEELVAWAHKQIGCGFDYFPCGVVCEGKCEAYSTEACDTKILEWLKQPADMRGEEDGNT